MEVPKKTYHMTLQSHTWPYTQRNHDLEGYMHPNVHCSIVYDRQDMVLLYLGSTKEIEAQRSSVSCSRSYS